MSPGNHSPIHALDKNDYARMKILRAEMAG